MCLIDLDPVSAVSCWLGWARQRWARDHFPWRGNTGRGNNRGAGIEIELSQVRTIHSEWVIVRSPLLHFQSSGEKTWDHHKAEKQVNVFEFLNRSTTIYIFNRKCDSFTICKVFPPGLCFLNRGVGSGVGSFKILITLCIFSDCVGCGAREEHIPASRAQRSVRERVLGGARKIQRQPAEEGFPHWPWASLGLANSH